jgi:MFS transporter, AAHS family, benzoate transport protein
MRAINPASIIDKSKLGKFHYVLAFWLFIVILFDGYDVVIYGAAIPSLIGEWGLSDVTAGAIGSYGVIGTVIGAVVLSIFADKIGKKNAIIISVVMFSLFTFLSGFAAGPIFFAICRVIAGIGLGGAMPVVVAIMTEFSPKKSKTFMVALVFTGYSTGAVLGALTGRELIPTLGWEWIFWLGGLPMLLLPFIIRAVPESIDYLLRKGKTAEALVALKRVNPSFSLAKGEVLALEVPKQSDQKKVQAKPSIKSLFIENRAISTTMFWLACFCSFILIYSMNTWLPRLLMESGFDLKSSLAFMAFMQFGAIIGTLTFGKVVDRLGFKKVLVPLYFAGGIALVLIGLTKNVVAIYALLLVVGAAVFSVQVLALSYVSNYYSSEVRTTAVGTTMGFGRMGGIVAPTLLGILLTMKLSPQFNFAAIGIVAVLGGVAMLFIQERYADYSSHVEKEVVNTKGDKIIAKSVPE